MNSQHDEREAIRERRREMIEKAKRRNKRRKAVVRFLKRFGITVLGAACAGLLIFAGLHFFGDWSDGKKPETENSKITEKKDKEEGSKKPEEEKDREGKQNHKNEDSGFDSQDDKKEEQEETYYTASVNEDTLELGEEIVSSNAVFIDLGSDTILARKDEKAVINPASMTKVLTLLVAAEHIDNLDDTFTITLDITDYSYINDCSNAGFSVDETVTVRDLLYGTILPSGADAALGLSIYVAGSHEAFVAMMNDKLKELGLSKTAHVTNCIGLYDKKHHCTVYDMAVILKAAVENELCREILSAHTYTTSKTKEHKEGITISNWFLRRIEDKDTGGEVLCGKTGYVAQSGNCAASYGVDKRGNEYICVTADASSGWRCIYDHVALYKQFAQSADES